MDVEKPEVNVKPQEVPGKKRVAHEVKHTEVHACIQCLSVGCVFSCFNCKGPRENLENITLTKR